VSGNVHVTGRVTVDNGTIIRGAAAPVTSDLGLYSQVSGNWIRLVTNNAPIVFLTDGSSSNNWTGSTAALTVNGTSVNTAGRFGIGVYVRGAPDTSQVGCDGSDTAIAGGATCHADYDQMLLDSHPVGQVGNGGPTGWYALCMNHANSGLKNPPQYIYVVCLFHGA
jgi:hypothetical protein